MRKLNPLIILLSLSFQFSTVLAQKSFPDYSDDPFWRVFECYWLEDCVTAEFKYDYDTTFCDKNYSKMKINYNNLSGYFRTDSLKTYFRNGSNCSDKEYLIYDFSLNIGDWVYVGYDINYSNKDTAIFILDAIDTIEYFGIKRRRFQMLFDIFNDGSQFNDTMYWIEGIGSEMHPFYPFKCVYIGCETRYHLRCYYNSTTLLYEADNRWSCDSLVSIKSEINNEYSVFPNPFFHEITISLQNSTLFQINFYSMVGNKILEFDFNNVQSVTIETSSLLPGFYILEMKTNTGILTKKIIKLE